MRANKIDFTGDPLLLRATDGAVTVSIPIRIRRHGGRKQVVVPQGISAALNATAAPTALQVALARGHRWLRQIESGRATNISAIAKAENVDRSYISRMINLTTLAPEIQAAILDETLPDTVSLFDLASDTPLSWEEQRGRVLLAS
ncbi:MAG: LacI family transcriptional regulator [Burkholderiaceae bacterium]